MLNREKCQQNNSPGPQPQAHLGLSSGAITHSRPYFRQRAGMCAVSLTELSGVKGETNPSLSIESTDFELNSRRKGIKKMKVNDSEGILSGLFSL